MKEANFTIVDVQRTKYEGSPTQWYITGQSHNDEATGWGNTFAEAMEKLADLLEEGL